MAFVAITSGQIAAGEPTAQDLFTKTKDNFDDHESRITTLETASNLYRPIEFNIVGPYSLAIIKDGLLHDLLRFDITVLNVVLFIHTAGSSAFTTVDVEYKRGVGAWTSILSTPVSASYSSGNFFTVAGTLTTTALLTNDLLRLNVDGVQVGGDGFTVLIEYEAA
jgi:hypothetical protein